MEKTKIGTVFAGKCSRLSYEGNGVLSYEGEAVYVEGVFPGDEGQIKIEYRRNGQWFGKIVSLSALSPNRIEPRCKVCRACGGCQFQQLSYQAQLDWKRDLIVSQFKKVAHMDVEVKPTVGMDEPYFYRNKIQMPFARDRKGHAYCGFYKTGTHVIVPVETCYIEDKRSQKILAAVRRLLDSFHLQPYDEDSRQGILRHVLIRTSHYKDQIMVVLVTNVDVFPSRNNFVKALIKECPEITTVVQNINSRATNVILGEKEHVLYGKGFIEDILCGITFRISPKSFYQTNPVMTEKLYEAAMVAGKLQKEDIAFDAYSGIGTIGFVASKHVAKVYSVEIVKEAVIDARANAKRNGIENVFSYCDDASSFMVRMAENNEKVDVLFMDPPRKGSDERFLKAVLKLKPSRIVYVSCNPSTLARDVAFLQKSYEVTSVQGFDMFPQTTHVEVVVSMSRVGSKL